MLLQNAANACLQTKKVITHGIHRTPLTKELNCTQAN
jgi:hypothetical protein